MKKYILKEPKENSIEYKEPQELLKQIIGFVFVLGAIGAAIMISGVLLEEFQKEEMADETWFLVGVFFLMIIIVWVGLRMIINKDGFMIEGNKIKIWNSKGLYVKNSYFQLSDFNKIIVEEKESTHFYRGDHRSMLNYYIILKGKNTQIELAKRYYYSTYNDGANEKELVDKIVSILVDITGFEVEKNVVSKHAELKSKDDE